MKLSYQYNTPKTFRLNGSKLSDEQQAFFDEQGFVVLAPSKESLDFKKILSTSFEKYLPDWNVGF